MSHASEFILIERRPDGRRSVAAGKLDDVAIALLRRCDTETLQRLKADTIGRVQREQHLASGLIDPPPAGTCSTHEPMQ